MIIKEDNLAKALDQALEQSVLKKEGKNPRERKFNESLDIIINFRDLDIKNPANKLAHEFLLPNPIRDKLNICIISDGDQLVEVKKKGYDYADKETLNDLSKKENKAKKQFVKKYDAFVVSAPLMRMVAKILGRFLGQSGKMPKPQPKGYGIIKPNESIDTVEDNFKRRVQIQTKRAPITQTVFGKKKMDKEKNFENLKALLNFIEGHLPNGQGNIKSIYLKTSMGKPVRVPEPPGRNLRGKKGGKK